jgi:hypothetical protein
MGRKKEKLIKLGDEILKNVQTPDTFINIQINDVELFCWNIKSLTGFSKVVMYLPGVAGFM